MSTFSKLQLERQAYKPALPSVLASQACRLRFGSATTAAGDAERVAGLFPHTYGKPLVYVEAAQDAGGQQPQGPLKIGCVLSGGQAPGGHNVIAGLFDYIKKANKDSVLYGFLDGPRGLFTGNYIVVDDALMDRYRSMGGFDMIGSGRDKIETPEQFSASLAVADRLGLDGVIVIGGDDSNTNAAVLAEYFVANGCRTKVTGVPKTIDGDLKVPEYIDVSFGFDTACKTYSELIGNVCLDALSSGKYYHFIRLMGRAASNITLECALQTHPNITLIGEEVEKRKQNLSSITEEIVHVILDRAAVGKHYGVVLVPEGLIEFVPEINSLLAELNDLCATGMEITVQSVADALSPNNAALFAYLPAGIKKQLLADRDPHGNVQVSLIETERLLAETVQHELDRLKKAGQFHGSFTYQTMFFGYEARCTLPSDFDTVYCYALGYNAGALVHLEQTGLISSVTNLGAPVEKWTCGGVPLTMLMNIERRKGKDKPVIRKALVDLAGLPFRTFAMNRSRWALTDCYRCPGPVQLDTTGKQKQADGTHVDPLCFTLSLELKQRSEPAQTPSHGSHGDLTAYSGLVDGTLKGGSPITGSDVERLHLYRLSHAISDAEHMAVLKELGITGAEWNAIIDRTRREVLHQSA